jgi:hypothetical protein
VGAVPPSVLGGWRTQHSFACWTRARDCSTLTTRSLTVAVTQVNTGALMLSIPLLLRSLGPAWYSVASERVKIQYPSSLVQADLDVPTGQPTSR